MRWQWKLGTFAGIDVFIHATFLLLIGWIGYSHWLQFGTIAKVVEGIAFILVLFLCVVLHEYGHALTARRYGVKTRDITLYPIGGVARLERMPEKPIEELWVALMGPAVNVVIAGLLFAYLFLTRGLPPMTDISVASGSFVARVMIVNIWLVLFNLIPAFPMDGGRVLRSLLALRLEYTRATRIAATVGQGLAVLFAIAGLFTNPFLLFIGLFVWSGAAQEASMVQMKTALGGVPVRRAMLTNFQALSPRDSLSRALQLILSGVQTDYPVVEDNGTVVGMLRRSDALARLSRPGQDIPVAGIMRRDFPTADANDMLEMALARLQASECQTMPVTYAGQLVGLLTLDNIGEFLRVQSALSRTHSRDRLQTREA